MESLEGTKAFAAVLTAGIVFMVAGHIGKALVHPRPLHESAIQIATPGAAPSGAPAAPAGPEPIGPLLANADVAAGQTVAQRQCGSCHTFTSGGANGQGPNLWSIVGRDHAGSPGFNFSPAMRGKAGSPWTYEELNAWLANPRAYLPGNRMAFGGLTRAQDRANVIAFLRTLDPSPKPLP